MQDLFGSVRRSFSLRSNPAGSNGAAAGEGTGARIVEKIGSCLRKSRVGFGLGLGFSPKLSQAMAKDDSSPIRWRKGELIGCGAFGHVYMGMNLDSGELLAVKQVLIGTNNASKEKAQAHIRELEEEVKLLKNLSHLNIVRYLGTVREEETLNILLEFVPGGSISSLLGKFGSFPEAVIKMYTKQLLQGLEYLHKSGIIHRDIKGANILVDNKGCIKLADFGASKQVAKLATMTAAKSMKGTPYWMAPEVILQTGHTYSADIWSVGCTVIEMATGKPPWSQQYQEVAALFHIGTTKSHPPIPEHLSSEAKNFLLKCLQKEPNLRPSASDLLQHPFVTNDLEDLKSVHCHSATDSSKGTAQVSKSFMNDLSFGDVEHNGGYTERISRLKPIWGTNSCDDMCQLFDKDELPGVESSFNPISEPFDGYPSKNDANLQNVGAYFNDLGESSNGEGKSTFPCDPTCEDDDDEVTEMKIRAFLDEKAHDLKKLQTPLYEEFFNSLSDIPEAFDRNAGEEHCPGDTELPFLKNSKPFSIKIASPVDTELPFIKNSKPFSGKIAGDSLATFSERSPTRTPRGLNIGLDGNPILREIPSAQLNELESLQDSQPEDNSPRHKKWKEELDQELERQREMRQANGAGKFSPLHRCASRRRHDRMAFMSPRK